MSRDSKSKEGQGHVAASAENIAGNASGTATASNSDYVSPLDLLAQVASESEEITTKGRQAKRRRSALGSDEDVQSQDAANPKKRVKSPNYSPTEPGVLFISGPDHNKKDDSSSR